MTLGPAAYEQALVAAGLNEITVFHQQSTGSTHDDARAMVASHRPLLESTAAIFIAETQTQGRGRGANVWSSPRGSISLTITLPGLDVSRLGVLPLGVGASVAKALRHLGANACVKWPNDVLIDGRKVCGILCESSLLAGAARVFIGIGVNVETPSTESPLPVQATTLAAHGITVDRPALVADITSRVLALVRGSAPGAEIVQDWKNIAVPWWGEEVVLVDGDVLKRVVLLDVNPEGHLVVRDEGGAVRSLVSGEVRQVRPARA
ncbi:MAG: biotin--[acetyl-CoA-carboxylase] ligase [Vicinamibacteria bacterium]